MAKWFRRKKETPPPAEDLPAWGDASSDSQGASSPTLETPDDGSPDTPEADTPAGPWIAFFHAVADPEEADRVRAFAQSFGESPKAEQFGVDKVGSAQDDLTQIFFSDSGNDDPDIAEIAEQWMSLIREELKPEMAHGDYVGLSLPDPEGGTRVLTARVDQDYPSMLVIERVVVDESGETEPIPAS